MQNPTCNDVLSSRMTYFPLHVINNYSTLTCIAKGDNVFWQHGIDCIVTYIMYCTFSLNLQSYCITQSPAANFVELLKTTPIIDIIIALRLLLEETELATKGKELSPDLKVTKAKTEMRANRDIFSQLQNMMHMVTSALVSLISVDKTGKERKREICNRIVSLDCLYITSLEDCYSFVSDMREKT